MPDSAAIIRHFGMRPHPEGGHYVRVYRSNGVIPQPALGNAFNGERPYSTAILYLLRQGEISRLHRLRQDEIWHFYLGGPLRLPVISPCGELSEVYLGRDILAGQHLQYAIPGGHWFAAAPVPGNAYTLVGCTVSPGFDFDDFELAEEERLKHAFPHLFPAIREFLR